MVSYHHFYRKKHDRGKRNSYSKRMQKRIIHNRWNQHNMSSYKVGGGWIQLRKSCWNLLGKECVRKEEIMRYASMMKAINIQRTKKISLINLLVIYEDSDESLEKMETIDNGYLWRCVNMNVGFWHLQKDLMIKSHLVRYDLISWHILISYIIYG